MSIYWSGSRSFRSLLPLPLAVAETVWISLWASILAGWVGLETGAGVSGWWILVLLLAAQAAVSVARRVSRRTLRGALVVGLGFIAVVLTIRLTVYASLSPLDFNWLGAVAARPVQVWSVPQTTDLVLFVGLVSWGRGVLVARAARSFAEASATFGFGLGALGAALLVSAIPGAPPTLSEQAGRAVIVFLAAGLLGVAMARLEDVNAEQRRNQDFELGVGIHWLGTLVAVLVLLLGVALLLSSVLTFDVIEAVLRPVGAVLDLVIAALVIAIATPIGYLIEWLIWLLRSLMGKPAKPPRPMDLGALFRQTHTQQSPVVLPPYLDAALRFAAGATVVLAITIVIYRSLSWWSELERLEGVPELRDFVIRWEDVRAEIWRWLARLIRRKKVAVTSSRLEDGGQSGDAETANNIRTIYRQFLRVGAWIGLPRTIAQTPFEYARRLTAEHEAAAAPIAYLTRAYVASRYGDEDADASTLEESRRALEQIRSDVERSTTDEENSSP